MKNLTVTVLISALLWCSVQQAAAQETPDVLKTEAYTKLRVAQQVMTNANNYMMSNPRPEDLRTAFQLYAQAGQLFQEAGAILKTLGTAYVSQQDIDGCDQAVKICLESMNKIRALLTPARR